MSVALASLARRMRDPRRDGPGEWLPRSGNTGPVRFPIPSRRCPDPVWTTFLGALTYG